MHSGGMVDEVHGDMEPEERPTGPELSAGSSSTPTSSGWLAFLTLDYYQSFFNVTTAQV